MNEAKIKKHLVNHKAFTDRLKNLMIHLLSSNDIKYQMVESRTKSIDSLSEKITRKQIDNVFTEVTDFTGIRIILYYLEDIAKVEEIIKSNFWIDEPNSIDKSKLLNNNEFGYLSVHYIVKMDENRHQLEEWAFAKELKAEIQVRTILQHSWAAIQHQLAYKKEEDFPNKLHRKLYRLAGLFELADEEFEQLKSASNHLKSEYLHLSEESKLDKEELNVLSLQATLDNDNSPLIKIAQIGFEIGFTPSKTPGKKYYEEELTPILRVAEMLKVSTIGELITLVESSESSFKKVVSSMLKYRGGEWSGTHAFMILLALLTNLTDDQLQEYVSKAKWAPTLWNYTSKSLRNI